MAKSRLNDDVYYPEIKILDEEDKNLDANIYEIQLGDLNLLIALGEPKYTFIEKNIIYYPVYLIKNDYVNSQIGVYEIMADKAAFVLDEDGDVDIDELGPILLYSYATLFNIRKILESDVVTESTGLMESETSKDEEDDLETSLEKGLDDTEGAEEEDENIDLEEIKIDDVNKESKEQAERESNSYKKRKGENWIETYMKNNNYKIVENEGGGDCLFASIRDGLEKGGILKSVKEMRKILSNEATEDLFQGYKELYDGTKNRLVVLETEIKSQKEEMKLLRAEMKKGNRDTIVDLTNSAKNLKDKNAITMKEKASAKNLKEEYEFMEGIETLEDFKKILVTCDFWGETWAISTLERILNIKLILFSYANYKDGDLDNVILCGQLNDSILQERGEFNPDYYILLEYVGNHYRLITYKNKGCFKFGDLPYNLKLKIINKCLEKAAGSFYLITDFKEMMEELEIGVEELSKNPKVEIEQVGLYNPSIILQFYSKSANQHKPGKGSGEQMNDKFLLDYEELSVIPEWRRKLSNFWVEPFKLDGHMWSSVEHYYQASKFKENNPDFYLSFSIDGNPDGELSKDPKMAKGAGGKSGKYKGKLIRDKQIKIDLDFFNGRNKEEMKKAQKAKFEQNEELKNLLIATKDAKLQHFVRGSEPEVFTELMEIRNELK